MIKRAAMMGTLAVLAMGMLAGCGQAPVASAPLSATADFDAERAYKIEDLLGIGPVYGEKLRKLGLTNTDKLLAACTTRNKRQGLAEEAGIPYKLVLAWAQKVELMKIHGVGPRGSNLLNAVFVRSVKDLAERNPENLAERVGVANAFKPRFLDNTPSVATITKWIEAAKTLPTDISNDQ
jgi:nucleotidyltransferase/DNA polymerase involved in DNA repair